MAITMDKLQDLTGYARVSLNKVFSRVDLVHELEPGTRGRARVFSEESAFEIACLCHLLRVGIDGPFATTTVREFLKWRADGKLPPFWTYNPMRPLSFGFPHNGQWKIESMAEQFADNIKGGWGGDPEPEREHQPASSLVVINLHEIDRRVREAASED